jgi:hypothetical protein
VKSGRSLKLPAMGQEYEKVFRGCLWQVQRQIADNVTEMSEQIVAVLIGEG